MIQISKTLWIVIIITLFGTATLIYARRNNHIIAAPDYIKKIECREGILQLFTEDFDGSRRWVKTRIICEV